MKPYFFVIILLVNVVAGCSADEENAGLKAGFAREKITPPVGTRTGGFGPRDYDPVGFKGIHDDLYARALYLSQGGEEALIMGFDLLFFSREETDRFKGALGRNLNLLPEQILFNTSHTHTGPKTGNWLYAPSDKLYLQFLENAIVKAALRSRNSTRDVDLWSGSSQTELPMSRRKVIRDGSIEFAPYPEGIICDTLPITLLKDREGKTVCLLFSVSCHPSTVKGVDRAYQVSADYPGVAMKRLDSYLGTEASLFLQGAGGDTKASVIGRGEDHWRAGTWDDVEQAGAMVAEEVIRAIDAGLIRVEPELKTHMIEMKWALAPLPTKEECEEIIDNRNIDSEKMLKARGYVTAAKPVDSTFSLVTGSAISTHADAKRVWAMEQISMIDRGYERPTAAAIHAQGIQLGKGLRLIGIEGELVAELGILIRDFFPGGVTFPMGYTNATLLYLPTSEMLDEGGYEVESYWEYKYPAPLAKGMENVLLTTLQQLKEHGIQ